MPRTCALLYTISVIGRRTDSPLSTCYDVQAMSDPAVERQALAAGLSCQPTSTGDQVLSYWELHLTAPEVIGLLLGVYAFFHVISYVALTSLYRQKR